MRVQAQLDARRFSKVPEPMGRASIISAFLVVSANRHGKSAPRCFMDLPPKLEL